MRQPVQLSYRSTRAVTATKTKKVISVIIIASICLLAIFF